MTEYLVEWTIDVEAVDALAAASDAWTAQRRTDSTANVFEVKDQMGMTTRVDLNHDEIGKTVWMPSNSQIADLAQWMFVEEDWGIDEVISMIRSPWKYADEYSKMIVEREFDKVAKEPEEIEEVTYHGLTRAECLNCGKVTSTAADLEIMNDLDPTCDKCGVHHVRWTKEDGTTADSSDETTDERES